MERKFLHVKMIVEFPEQSDKGFLVKEDFLQTGISSTSCSSRQAMAEYFRMSRHAETDFVHARKSHPVRHHNQGTPNAFFTSVQRGGIWTGLLAKVPLIP